VERLPTKRLKSTKKNEIDDRNQMGGTQSAELFSRQAYSVLSSVWDIG